MWQYPSSKYEAIEYYQSLLRSLKTCDNEECCNKCRSNGCGVLFVRSSAYLIHGAALGRIKIKDNFMAKEPIFWPYATRNSAVTSQDIFLLNAKGNCTRTTSHINQDTIYDAIRSCIYTQSLQDVCFRRTDVIKALHSEYNRWSISKTRRMNVVVAMEETGFTTKIEPKNKRNESARKMENVTSHFVPYFFHPEHADKVRKIVGTKIILSLDIFLTMLENQLKDYEIVRMKIFSNYFPHNIAFLGNTAGKNNVAIILKQQT